MDGFWAESGRVGSGRIDSREPISALGPDCMTRARDMYENEPLLARLTKDIDPTFFFSSLWVTKKLLLRRRKEKRASTRKRNGIKALYQCT